MEANQNRYFVDGFCIKHFGIWPVGVDKNDLFDDQKIFLVYLMGIIPEMSDWQLQMSYRKELNEIKELTRVEINQTEIDVAQLQGRDIEELRRDRLKQEKNRRINELNKKYGIKQDDEVKESISIPQESTSERQRLWDILQGKGLIKNGLQDKT